VKENKNTHCEKGHKFTKENTFWFNGKRQCKECQRQRRIAEAERNATTSRSGRINK
jgi:hypothetical protein